MKLLNLLNECSKLVILAGLLVAQQLLPFTIFNHTATEQRILMYPLTWDATYSRRDHLAKGRSGAYRRYMPYYVTIAPHSRAVIQLARPPYENFDIVIVGDTVNPYDFITSYEQQTYLGEKLKVSGWYIDAVTDKLIDIQELSDDIFDSPEQEQIIHLHVHHTWGNYIENSKNVDKTIIFLDGAWRELPRSQRYIKPILPGRIKKATITNAYGLLIQEDGSIAAVYPTGRIK